jgi:hypothetical protein
MTWKFIGGLAFVAANAVLLSCAPTVTVTPLGSERTYPPTPDTASIPLYSTVKPACPYDEIAAITAEGIKPDNVVLAALRAKARALGGQAITGYTQQQREDGTSVRSGTAIRFRSADCTK